MKIKTYKVSELQENMNQNDNFENCINEIFYLMNENSKECISSIQFEVLSADNYRCLKCLKLNKLFYKDLQKIINYIKSVDENYDVCIKTDIADYTNTKFLIISW